MVNHTKVESKNKKSFICSWLPSAILVSTVFFIGSALLISDYKERFLQCNLHPRKVNLNVIKAERSNPCEHECRPVGTKTLPRGIVSVTTDLKMRSLSGPLKKKLKSPTNLLAMAVGAKQKKNVNEIVKKFPLTEFVIMLFHYDGNMDGWKDFEWSNSVIHVSAINQTKWWFAKRFLHPDVAQYDYIFLWDEDLGVENFHAGRYLSIVKEEELHISQPAIDPDKSEVHYKITAREINSTVHRKAINYGRGVKCYEGAVSPPCTAFVELMAPVFSAASWRCAWHMIQNDMIHAWGVDWYLRHCAMGDGNKNMGIVDSEYVIHLSIPTLGSSTTNKIDRETEKLCSPYKSPPNSVTVIQNLKPSDERCAVRRASESELKDFIDSWTKAETEDGCWVDPYPKLTYIL